MFKNFFLLFSVCLMATSQAFATSFVCKKGSLERRVETTPISPGHPCQVKYFKESGAEGSVLWSAKNKSNYCEDKANQFVQKLKTFGWHCADGSVSPSSED